MSEHYVAYHLWNIVLKGFNREGCYTILRTTVRAPGLCEAAREALEEAERKGWGSNFLADTLNGTIQAYEMSLAVTSDPFPES